MVVKKVNHNTIDAFLDKGWDYWGRFKVKFSKEGNQVFQIKGTRFPNARIAELEARYNQRHPAK